MDFWKGTFSPLHKHIMRVKYIPLSDMNPEDIPDVDELRESQWEWAIDEVEANVEGYFEITINQHKKSKRPHGGQKTYYYPATKEMIEDFKNGELDYSIFYAW